MDLAIFEARELAPVLSALRGVALANGALGSAQAAFVEGIAHLHGQRLAAEELTQVDVRDVARVLTDPHRRKRAVQLAIIMGLVEGQPTPAGAAKIQELARALHVPEAGLRVLTEVAHGHMMFARFDILRRMRRFLHNTGAPGFLALAVPSLLGMTENADVAARYRALGQLPTGTLGRAVFDHYREHAFAFPGEKGGIPEAMLFHDVGHVLSGYGVDPQGEIQQAAFQAGFVRNDGFLFLLFGILQFHVGVRLTPIAQAEHGYFDVPRVLQALARGAACKVDLSDHFNLFEYAEIPTGMLRARWGISAV